MNKKISLLLLCLAICALVVHTQAPPPLTSGSSSSTNPNNDQSKATPPAPAGGSSTQVQALSAKPPTSWTCTIQFYYNGKPYYTDNVKYGATTKYRGSFTNSVNNKISAIYWKGTRCYCWVVVYQEKYFNGLNLGLWTDSTSGNYQLNKYITWDWSDGAWESWDKTVSSYAIYCY